MTDDVVRSKAGLLFRTGLSLARRGNMPVAASTYGRVLALVPNHAGASITLAAALASQDRLMESRDVLLAFTQNAPGDVGAHYRYGLTLAQLGDHTGAERAFSRVLEIEPGHSGAPRHRAAALGQMQRAATDFERGGQLPEAVELLRAIAAAKPEDAAARYRLGLALARLGDHVSAETAFARVLELDPDHSTAQVHRTAALGRMSGLATTLERDGKLSEALDFLRAIVKAKPDDVAALHRLGLALARSGDHVGAEIVFARVLELDPGHSAAPVHRDAALARMSGLATTLERGGKVAEAVDFLRALAKAKPDDAGTHFRLGLALTRMGDPVGAEATLTRVLELDPDHANARVHHAAALGSMGRLATALERDGDTSGAIGLLRVIAKAKPDDAGPHYRLGLALARLGDPIAAEAMFARVIELDPTHASVNAHRASALNRMKRLAAAAETKGQLADAIGILRRIAKSNAGDVDAHYRLGLSLARSGDRAGADAAIAQVLILDPDHAGARTYQAGAVDRMGRLATTFEREGRLAEAADLLRAITRAMPNDVKSLHQLGMLLGRLGDPAGAEAALGRVLELDPHHKGALARRTASLGRMSRLATTLEQEGRLAEAADVLRAVVQARPDDVRSLYRLGTVLVRLGENAGAEAAFGRVLELDPDHASAPVQLAAVLGRVDRFADAAEVLRTAAQAKPESAELPYRLGQILTRLKDYAGAKAAYESVLAIDPAHAGALGQLAVTTGVLSRLAAAAGDEPSLREMLQVNPADIQSRLQLIDHLQHVRRYPEALIVGQEHLDSQPYDVRIRRRMARLEILRGNSTLAQGHYRAILDETPQDVSAFRILSALVYGQGRQEEARQLHGQLGEMMRASMPSSLKQGLYDIAEACAPPRSTEASAPVKKLAIPSRRDWLPEQRLRWGRRVHQLFFDWGCFQPDGMAEIRDLVKPPEWRAFKHQQTGAIFAGSHIGSYVGAMAHLIGTRYDYRLTSANPAFIMSFPERAVDAKAKDSHRVLTRLVSFLRKGGLLYLAGDGQVGKKFDSQFVHKNYRTKFPVALPAMAYFSNVPVFWFNSVWRGRSMTVELIQGPRVEQGEKIESWYERWFAFYWERYREALDSGPENISSNQFERL